MLRTRWVRAHGSRFLVVVALCAVIVAVVWQTVQPRFDQRLVHTEPSSFAPVLVIEEFGQRCMTFSSMADAGRQTCLWLQDPDRLVFAYTRMMMAGLLLQPEPQSVLMIGLGGATLPLALAKLYPSATIDSVEIDPAVVRVAERYFGYVQGPRQRVVIEDGRQFVEQALAQGRHYDLILLDAFDVDYIPAQLMTVEFFQLLRRLLSADGVFVANSFTLSKHYARETATYVAAFGEVFNLRSRLEGNRVVIASNASLPNDTSLQARAQALAEPLGRFGVTVHEELSRFDRVGAAQLAAEPLTDNDTWE